MKKISYQKRLELASKDLEQAFYAICLKYTIPECGLTRTYFKRKKEIDGLKSFIEYTLKEII
jgi:hypothetical protein